MTTFSDPGTPLRAVVPVVPEYLLEWRRAAGVDRWDEMWDGVLHMTPTPNRMHQDFEWWFETWLRNNWATRSRGIVNHQMSVAPNAKQWTRNYRVPDLSLVLPERMHIDHNEFFAGPPNVVVEIQSPGDESFEKLPFYFDLGVDEAWVIERDRWKPTVFVRGNTRFEEIPATVDGWVKSPVTGVEMLHTPPDTLTLRQSGDDATRADYRSPR